MVEEIPDTEGYGKRGGFGPGTDPSATPPARPKVYVSYSWARERREPLVAELCVEAGSAKPTHPPRQHQLAAQRPHLPPHGTTKCGLLWLVILSRAYTRSEYCMSELCRLYTNARQRDKAFLRRILLLPLIQDNTRIATPYERIYTTVSSQSTKDNCTLVKKLIERALS